MTKESRTRVCEICGEEFPVLSRMKGNRCRKCIKSASNARYRAKHRGELAAKAQVYNRECRDAYKALREHGRGPGKQMGNERNTKAELMALRTVEILEVAPEAVTEYMWENLCILLGGEVLNAGGGEQGARRRAMVNGE